MKINKSILALISFGFLSILGAVETENASTPKSFEREDYDKKNILKYEKYYLFNGGGLDKRFFIDYMDEERIAGQSYCNIFFGSIKKGKLTKIGTTMMSCRPSEMKSEQTMLNLISDSTLLFEGDKIIIKKGSKQIILKKL